MDNEKLVSFVVLTYNSEKYLQKCLDSILNQDYKNFEIIIVDGGSNDRTMEICRQYSANYNNVKVFEYPNSSIGMARQKGVEHSKGDFCAFIDSDCVLPSETWLKNMLDGFNKPEIVGTWVLGAFSKSDPSLMRYSILSNPHRETVPELVGYENYIPIGTGHTIIRKDKIFEVGGFKDIPGGEDVDLTYELVKRGYKFRYIYGNEVYHYHVTSLKQKIRKMWRNVIGGLNSEAWTREYVNAKKMDAILGLTIIYPLFYGIFKTIRSGDSAWLWHPVISFLKVIVGVAGVLYVKVIKLFNYRRVNDEKGTK